MEWNCPDCKTNNSEDITRCTCGYDIDRGSPSKSTTAESRIHAPKSNNNIVRNPFVIGILILLTIIALFLMFAPSERVNSVKETWLRISKDPAQICLDNARLKLLDPDNARVISFSYVPEEFSYVLKYKSKNSYGAYVEGEYFCDAKGSPDDSIERLTKKIKAENAEREKILNRGKPASR